MALFVAALFLGAALSPPPRDDDDKKPSASSAAARRERAAAPAPLAIPPRTGDEDEDEAKPSTRSEAKARGSDGDDEGDEDEGRVPQSSTIIVSARRLDAARTQIDQGLGASVYSLTNETIENRPGGETGSVADILAQAPGVTLSGTRLEIRGSPANEVRINNVILPEAISDPAEQLSARLAETTSLVTGTLPAQFGFAPAGVISITTKNGLYEHGGQLELFAGTDAMIEPALEWSGSVGATSLFGSSSLERGRAMLADAEGNAAEERRLAVEGIGFADHVIDGENRLSLILGGMHERKSIKRVSAPAGREINGDGYAAATYQHTRGGFTLQASLFAGLASGEAAFIDKTRQQRSSWGTQIDASETIGQSHRLRFGLLGARSRAHELGPGGAHSTAARAALATYVQDEWRISSTLTLDPGARAEWLHGLGAHAMVEPRASLVYASPRGLAAHLGYARYGSAAPLGEGASGKGLPDEQDDYWDAGVQQKAGALSVGLDGYWREARNYLAQHQAIGSAVPMDFAFTNASIRGLGLSVTYALHRTTAWLNISLTRARASGIIGGEAIFAPATIAAALGREIPLASERPVTASAGFTRRLGKLSLSGDVLLSSGAVRTLATGDPDGDRRAPYGVVGLAAVYHARLAGQPADLRLDLTNLTNVRYAASDAASLEGGWTRWGRRRAITIGIEQGF